MRNSKFQIGDRVTSKYAADKTRPYRVAYISEIAKSMLHTHMYQYCLEDSDHVLYIVCEDDLLSYEDVEPPVEKCPVCGSDAIVGLFTYSSTNETRRYVECDNVACSFRGPERKTRLEAIEVWNTIVNKIQMYEPLKKQLLDKLEIIEQKLEKEL